MSTTPNFSAVLANINEQRQTDAERNLALVRAWSAGVARSLVTANPSDIGPEARSAAKLISKLGTPTDSEVMYLCAALFDMFAPNMHVNRNRAAMAALSDIISDFEE
jgi:hypothetical protein